MKFSILSLVGKGYGDATMTSSVATSTKTLKDIVILVFLKTDIVI